MNLLFFKMAKNARNIFFPIAPFFDHLEEQNFPSSNPSFLRKVEYVKMRFNEKHSRVVFHPQVIGMS